MDLSSKNLISEFSGRSGRDVNVELANEVLDSSSVHTDAGLLHDGDLVANVQDKSELNYNKTLKLLPFLLAVFFFFFYSFIISVKKDFVCEIGDLTKKKKKKIKAIK